jgi:hypothetical protein
MRSTTLLCLTLITCVGCQGVVPRAAPDATATAAAASAADAVATVDPLAAPVPDRSQVEPTAEPLATTIPIVRATPAPLPTRAPASEALVPSATGLQTKLAALRTAQRTNDVGTALRAQRELMAAADQAEAALKSDKSPDAQSVRAAIADIRSGIGSGDSNGFDHADATLRQVLNGGGGLGITASEQAQPVATFDLHQLQEQVRGLNQAIQNKNSGDALRLQGQLLAGLSAAQKAAAADNSADGKALTAALSDLQKGLDGDSSRLAAAATALDKMGVTADQKPTVATDVPRVAASLGAKIDAFRAAASTGSRVDVLRLQQQILDETDQAATALTLDQTPSSAAVRNVLNDVRAGVSGDLSKLDGARSELAKAAGETAPTARSDQSGATTSGTSNQPIADLKRFASDVDDTVSSFQTALQKNDTGTMLRLQRRLSDLASQADTSLKESQTKPADEVRTAMAAIRTAFAGDLAKLDEAHVHLRNVSGAASSEVPVATSQAQAASSQAQAASSQVQAASRQAPAATPPSGSLSSPPTDVQTAATNVHGRVADLSTAVRDRQTADEIDKRRAALKTEIDKAEAALNGTSGPRADSVRAALQSAREAAGGDDTKVATAQAAIEKSLSGQ